MESVGVLPSSLDVRHEPHVLPSMSTPKQHKPLKRTSSLRPEFFSSPIIRENLAGPSRHMVSSPLRTCSPVTPRVPLPLPIDTSVTTPTRTGAQALERVPTEPASAPPPPQQPTAAELAVLGIKVRDFAFEPSTLPRVPTVRKPLPYFRDLKRQREETAEELEARKRNEARRLEFNTPRRRDETPEARELRMRALNNPFIISTLETDFYRSAPSVSVAAGPSLSSRQSPSPKTRTPLQRQPSEYHMPRISTNSSMVPLLEAFFANSHPQPGSPSPSRSPPSRAISAYDLQTRNSLRPPSISIPRLNLQSLSQFLPESQSQFESQFESQSQGAGSSQAPLPGLSTSQTDSEMDSDLDDEGYVKTPLVTPNGSLILDNDGDLDLIHLNNVDAETTTNSNDTESTDNTASNVNSNQIEVDNTIIDSSTLPESQVAELLAPVETGPEEDVSVSQMGLFESQDLFSQPAWQQLSQLQSQFQYSSQLPHSQAQDLDVDGDGDVDMPASLPDENDDETKDEKSDSVRTPAPRSPPIRIAPSTVVSPPMPCASVSSNHAASSSQPRPIPRTGSSLSSSSRRSSGSNTSHSLLRRRSSSTGGLGLSRRASLSSIKTSSTPKVRPSTATSSSASGPGKARYNLRTPSPKKSKFLGVPMPLSASLPSRRVRSHSAPERNVKASTAANKAGGKRATSKSTRAAQTRKRRDSKGTEEADVVMGEENVEATS